MGMNRQRHVACLRVVPLCPAGAPQCAQPTGRLLSLVPGSRRSGFPVPTAGTATLLFSNQTAQGFNSSVTVSGWLSWTSQTPPRQLLLEAIIKETVGLRGRGERCLGAQVTAVAPGKRDAALGGLPSPRHASPALKPGYV